MAITGAQGSGKTTFAKNIFNKHKGARLFIAPDVFDPSLSDLPFATGNVSGKITFDKKIIPALIQFKNGLLVFDDARFYFDKGRDENFRKILIRRRQFNRNIVFIAHSINEIPPSYFYFFTHIALFKGHLSPQNLNRIPVSEYIAKHILQAQYKANTGKQPVIITI